MFVLMAVNCMQRHQHQKHVPWPPLWLYPPMDCLSVLVSSYHERTHICDHVEPLAHDCHWVIHWTQTICYIICRLLQDLWSATPQLQGMTWEPWNYTTHQPVEFCIPYSDVECVVLISKRHQIGLKILSRIRRSISGKGGDKGITRTMSMRLSTMFWPKPHSTAEEEVMTDSKDDG